MIMMRVKTYSEHGENNLGLACLDGDRTNSRGRGGFRKVRKVGLRVRSGSLVIHFADGQLTDAGDDVIS